MQLIRSLACLHSQALLTTFAISNVLWPLPLILLYSWNFPLRFEGLLYHVPFIINSQAGYTSQKYWDTQSHIYVYFSDSSLKFAVKAILLLLELCSHVFLCSAEVAKISHWNLFFSFVRFTAVLSPTVWMVYNGDDGNLAVIQEHITCSCSEISPSILMQSTCTSKLIMLLSILVAWVNISLLCRLWWWSVWEPRFFISFLYMLTYQASFWAQCLFHTW